jgi:hypothetical protein
LTGLIKLQSPPLARVGVMELRDVLSCQGALLARDDAPQSARGAGFQSWLEGDPLDVGALLYGAGGKPRIAIARSRI